LRDVDRGKLSPDPMSRLGAYAANRGYAKGTVGHAVHDAIGTIYATFGTYGEENIGVIFNSPQAKALFADPVTSPSSRRIAEIEYAYWQRVLREDPTSGGGRLGSAFPPMVRDFLQRDVFTVGDPPAGGASSDSFGGPF